MSIFLRNRILAVLPGVIPSTTLTVIKPLLALERAGKIQVRVTLEWLVHSSDLEWADILVFCRNCEPDFSSALRWASRRGKPFIYDIDDNLFDLPDDTEDLKYYGTPERQAMLLNYISHAALVRVYSRPMYEHISNLTTKVVRVPTPIDLDLIKIPAQIPIKPIKIIYATSRKMDQLFPLFLPALKRILYEYKGRVEAHFWGFFARRPSDYTGIHFHTPIANYDEFMRKFSHEGFSIGLAPLLDTNFYRSKTNNKFREYGSCRIAGIYSKVEVYTECVINEVTGLLVENTEEGWYHAMSRLIEDQPLRQHIQTQAEVVVRDQYSESRFEQTWLHQVQTVIAHPPVLGLTQPVELPADYQSVSNTKSTFDLTTSQVQKVVMIIRNNGILSAIERLIYKLEQITLLAKISFLRRL